MFNETLVQENYSEGTPWGAIVFSSFMLLCCFAGCVLIPKWSYSVQITPV